MRCKCFIFLLLTLCFAAVIPTFAQSQLQVFTTAQRFEGGLMLWRSDTGLIWVLADNGQAYSYSASAYSPLPDNPFYQAPANRYRPINGFGKVWGSNSTIRTLLGWATLPEIGFNMPITTRPDGTNYLTQLNGKIYEVKANTWQLVTAIPPSNINAQIVSFAVTPTSAKLGDSFTVTWEVGGKHAEFALLEVSDTGAPDKPFLYYMVNLPMKGSKTLNVPLETSGDLRVTLWAQNVIRPNGFIAIPNRLVSSSATITVQKTPTTVQAAFQQYQNGFMLWRGDTGAVMVFYNTGLVTVHPQHFYETYQTIPMNIPPGYVTPVNAFGLLWSNHWDVQQGLGYATAAEQGYPLSINGGNFTLPDGRIAKTNGNAWGF